MAKRFTDTDKWNQVWFRKLTPKMKAAWIYLCDKCDIVGVWSIDMDSMSFHVGEEVTLDELLSALNVDKDGRVIQFKKDRLFISDFISFQYGKLSSACKPHKPVIALLSKYTLLKGFPKGINTLEEQDQDKEKEKEQEKEQEKQETCQNKNSSTQAFDASLKNPDWNAFLKEWNLDRPTIKARLPDIMRHFETVDDLKLWLEGVTTSKGFEETKRKDGFPGAFRYVSSAINSELEKAR